MFLSNLVRPKRNKEIAVDNYHDEHIGLYELPENTIDVLYIGSSHVFSSISPEDIFHNYGITGYVQSSSCQKVWQSYDYLLETYKTQTPKVVVLDTFMVLDNSPQSEAFNREAIDKMKFSLEKINSIIRAVKFNPDEEELMSYIFPLFRYHDRWEELKEEDFAWFVTNKNAPAKGFLARIGTVPAEFNIESYEDSSSEKLDINETGLIYLNKIKELCEINGTQLILTKFPTCLWNGSSSETIQRWSKEQDIPFLDYNADENLRKKVNIDWSLESLDGGNHLNYDGAMKMSMVFGEYLKTQFVFEDKRKNKSYQQWDEDYKYYKKCVDNFQLNHTISLDEYFNKLNESNYYIFISCNSFEILENKLLVELLNQLGINQDYLHQLKGKNNLFFTQGNKKKYSKISEQNISIDSNILRKNWSIACKKLNEEIVFECIINKHNYAMGEYGLQIVVYDELTDGVVDSSCIIVDETNELKIKR